MSERRMLPGVTELAGIRIYNKNALRASTPYVGERYAVRTGSGHVRGPYEVERLLGAAYSSRALHGIEGFPYVGGVGGEEPGAVEDWRPDYDD